MPASVVAVTAILVLPLSLSRAFEHSRDWPLHVSEYRDGSTQRKYRPTTSRKSWRLGKALTPAEMVDLETFFEDRSGSLEPFFFYDGIETTPKWSWDETGASTVGRYTVRFRQEKWSRTLLIPRCETSIELIELS